MASQPPEGARRGPGDNQGDWRRRRGRRRPEAAGPGPRQPLRTGDSPSSGDEDEASSRPILSLLEPSIDAISSFGAPIVIAGTIGLIAGICVVAFVGSMSTYGYVDIGIGGGLILLVALISFSSVVATFLSRTGRYGFNTVIMVLAFTGIVVVINFISFGNSSRSDVTATNQFSLARSTKQLLRDLEEKVRVTAFYLDESVIGANPSLGDLERLSRRSKVEETLREFRAIRSSRFDYRFIDFTLQPEIVREYFGGAPTPFISEALLVEGLNTGINDVVRPGDRNYGNLEQDLYTSILVATGRDRKTVYFLSGHGERGIRTSAGTLVADAGGYDDVRLGLNGDNYDVRTLFWNPSDEEVRVPHDPDASCASNDLSCQPGAAMVVIASPTDELPPAHARELNRYLRGKTLDEDGQESDRVESARLIFLAEPDTPDTFREFMSSWGIIIDRGYIRDLASSVPGLPQTLQLQSTNPLEQPEVYGDLSGDAFTRLVSITAPEGKSLGIIRMPGATAIRSLGSPNLFGVRLTNTTGESYLIADLARTGPITGGAGADPRGPFTPAAYFEARGPAQQIASSQLADNQIARIVVFGDSDFLNNQFFGEGGGADFFLNSANYLLGDFSLVSIRPKASAFREFNLDRNEDKFVKFSSWLFMPGILGLMAALVWWVRR